MHSHWSSIIPSLEARLGLAAGSLNACHVDALWQLCTLESGLMSTDGHLAWQQQQQQGRYSSSSGISSSGSRGGDGHLARQQQQQQQHGRYSSSSSGGGACGLFSQSDAMLLEWLEDVRLFETQGYGAEVRCTCYKLQFLHSCHGAEVTVRNSSAGT
jgi:hypothetical protein